MDGVADTKVAENLARRNAVLLVTKDKAEYDKFMGRSGGINEVLKRCRMGRSMIFRLSADLINMDFKKEVRQNPPSPNIKMDDALNRVGLLVLHGYGITWPDAFGLKKGTLLANAMDASRKGYYKTG
jgi:hypothetical protein